MGSTLECLTILVVLLQAQTPVEITVRCFDSGKEVQIKVFPQTLLQKVFTAFAERLSLDIAKLRFLDRWTGIRLHWHESLQEAEIDDGDVIICMSERVGD